MRARARRRRRRCDALHVLREFVERLGPTGTRNLQRAAQSGLIIAICDALLPSDQFAPSLPQFDILGGEFVEDAATVLAAAVRFSCAHAPPRKPAGGEVALDDFVGMLHGGDGGVAAEASELRTRAAAAAAVAAAANVKKTFPLGDMMGALVTLLPTPSVHQLCVDALWDAVECLHPAALPASPKKEAKSPTSSSVAAAEGSIEDLRASTAAQLKQDALLRARTPAARAIALGRDGGAPGVLTHLVCKAGAAAAARWARL
jgi:hypothetical protein